MRYAHSSVFGSYLTPCEILETHGNKSYIIFFDRVAEEIEERWVDNTSLWEDEE